MREALSLGISCILEQLRALVFVGAAWSADPEQGGRGELPSLGEENPSALMLTEWKSPDVSDPLLATGIAWALLSEMQNTVGWSTDDAVMLLDGTGRVLCMNVAAERLAKSQVFNLGSGGTVVFSDAEANRVFRKKREQFFMQEVEQLEALVGKEMLMVFRQAVPGLGLASLMLRNLVPVDVPIETLQRVLGVSPMQAKMAQAVMRGLGPVEYAKENNCSVKTARFHLYRLMGRFGIHSQVELLNFLVRSFS